MNKFMVDFCDYVCSGHALLYIDTFEEDRAISEIAEMAKQTNRQLYIWSIAQGWIDTEGKTVSSVQPVAPIEEHLKAILEFDENTICVFRDFHTYIKHETYAQYDVVIGWLDALRRIIASVGQTIVFVGPEFETPKTLLHDITRIEFDLPDRDQIGERIDFACSSVTQTDGSKFQPNKSIIPQVIDACRGMTSQQIVDRATLALRKHKNFDQDAVQTIIKEKAGVIKASGLLSYVEPPKGGLNNVGGYDALKKHIQLDRPCFTEKARKFGIEFPRGLMMVGIPGCGKTLLALSIASELNLPLVSMDIGNLMGSLVGESESQMRQAIKLIEGVAPCVLLVDEIEKGFGGAGDSDGGTSRRVFGAFIKWLNDKESPVYVVATANQIQSLPPELSRKGRFDEIYGLDLPNLAERQEIFRIHISKRGRDATQFDIQQLAEKTNGYTGADVEPRRQPGNRGGGAAGDGAAPVAALAERPRYGGRARSFSRLTPDPTRGT